MKLKITYCQDQRVFLAISTGCGLASRWKLDRIAGTAERESPFVIPRDTAWQICDRLNNECCRLIWVESVGQLWSGK